MPELDKLSKAPLSRELPSTTDGSQPSLQESHRTSSPLEFPLPRVSTHRDLDRGVLLRLQERALRFLVRGVVHRMNNVLAVFSSHAQLQKIRTSRTRQEGRSHSAGEREVQHLLQSVDQGEATMNLLGSLLRLPGLSPEKVHPFHGAKSLKGDLHHTSGICLGTFFRSLEEVLLCESQGQRFPVQIHADLQVYASVSPSALLLIVSLLLEHLVTCVPTDLPGALELDIREDEEGPTLRVSFERDARQLPFPVQPADLDPDLAQYLICLGIKLHGLPGRPAYELVLPPLGH